MRSVFTFLAIALFLIIFYPVYAVIWLIGKKNPHKCAAASQKIVARAFKFVLWVAGARVTVKGVENIPADKAVMYTSNHRSYADIPMAYTTVPTLTGFIAKKEIEKIPILSLWMKNMHCLFLDRGDLKQNLKIILQAIDNVKAGYSVFIMPEGTRNHEPEMLPFKEGSFKIAEKTGCPIIPVAISNSDELFELHQPWVRKARVMIHYGKPIDTSAFTREDFKGLGARVREEIAAMLEEDKGQY